MTTSQLETKFAPVDLREVDLSGRISGYASLFGVEDLGRDIVMRGAFQNSLKRRGVSGIKMLFQHDPAEPIGVWHEIREDDRGLYVEGQLLSDVARGREVLSLMRVGALDGLSIGYQVVKGRKDRARGTRQLIEVDLWEISVVTFPMLPGARVEKIKKISMTQGFPTEREFERWLVRDAGFTRSQARIAIASGFKALVASRDAGGMAQAQDLAAKLRQAAKMMRKASQGARSIK